MTDTLTFGVTAFTNVEPWPVLGAECGNARIVANAKLAQSFARGTQTIELKHGAKRRVTPF